MYRPRDILPISDTQPFTHRASYTFLEKLRNLYDLFEKIEGDFGITVEHITEIVNTINNRVGSPPAIQVDLSNGNVDVEIPVDFPSDHVFYIVVRQGVAGGNTVTMPAEITGNFAVDKDAGAISFIRVIPNGDGTFFTDEEFIETMVRVDALSATLVSEIEEINTTIIDFKHDVDVKLQALNDTVNDDLATAIDNMNSRVTDVENSAVALSASVDTRLAAQTATVNAALDAVRGDLTALDTTLRQVVADALAALDTDVAADLVALRAEVATQLDAVRDTINDREQSILAVVSTKVDKSVIINVKDFNAKGDGVTDDTAAIRAAIIAGGQGQTIFFPKGKYIVSNTINMELGQRWVGAAFNGDQNSSTSESHIKFTHDGIGIFCAYGKSASIESIRIEGPGFNYVNSKGLTIESSSFTTRDVAIRNFAVGISMKECWYASIERTHLYLNSRGVTVDYCYNATFTNVRIHADRGDGIYGNGMVLTGKSMVTLMGGSIEAYKIGIDCTADGSVTCFGTYFESAEKATNLAAIGIRGDYSFSQNICVIGCQVYLNGHDAWISMLFNQGGERITAIGNKLKASGPGTTPCTVYKWANGHSSTLALFLVGDSIASAKADGHAWISDNAAIPLGSIIMPPLGYANGTNGELGTGMLSIGGGLAAHNIGSVFGAIIPASMSAPIPLASMPVGWNGKRQGAIMYNSTTKKLNVWTGTGWVDAIGGVAT